jgi:hypothetical protein
MAAAGIKGFINAASGVFGLAGETADNATQLARKAGNTATAATGQALDTTKDVTVSTLDATGRITKTAANTAASTVEGTASAIVNTASKITAVAAQKGKAIAEANIAKNRATENAILDPDNVTLQEDAARDKRQLNITVDGYKNEEERLRAVAQNQTRKLQIQTQVLREKDKAGKGLNRAQNRALVSSANALKTVVKAEAEAARIELAAHRNRKQQQQLVTQENECLQVLQELTQRGVLVDSAGDAIPLDMVSQNNFCKEKINCDKTGKVVGAFGFSRKNPGKCTKIAQRYANLKNSNNPSTASNTVGGKKKKTRKKKSTAKRHTKKRTKKRTKRHTKRRTKKHTKRHQ